MERYGWLNRYPVLLLERIKQRFYVVVGICSSPVGLLTVLIEIELDYFVRFFIETV